MSNDENSTEKESAPKSENTGDKKASVMETVGNIIASILKLKEEKPKVLYGGVGVVVILILIMMMSGGSSEKNLEANYRAANLVVGKNYVLRSPNAYDNKATVRLVSAPGSLEAYDDTEKADRSGCKHLPQGTKVTLQKLADAYGKTGAFGQVTVLEGECKGQSNWTLTVNIQQN